MITIGKSTKLPPFPRCLAKPKSELLHCNA